MNIATTRDPRPPFALLALSFASIALVGLLAACGTQATAADQPTAKTANVTLNILAAKPGTTDDGPLFDNTDIKLPANALVTMTIVNQDPGDQAMPANTPFAKVTGTLGNTASLDGVAYSALDMSKISHTFSVPKLGLNVPIPGDVPNGQKAISVTFTFKTGQAGTYVFQCFDPCGTDPNGYGGPMAKMGYMMGTITVQ